jgi:hypothetical protein
MKYREGSQNVYEEFSGPVPANRAVFLTTCAASSGVVASPAHLKKQFHRDMQRTATAATIN